MKNKLVLALGVLLVFGLVLVACDNGNNPEAGNNPGDGDIFAGTWVGTPSGGPQQPIKYINTGGSFRGYYVHQNTDYEFVRGTYTVSGSTVTVKITQMNNARIDNNGPKFTGSDDWQPYAKASSYWQLTSDTFTGTIVGNQVVLNGISFKKQP
jgi:hypothetical protein